MSKSFGVLTPEEMQAALNAQAGGALKIIRRKDPQWGIADNSLPMKPYRVKLRAEFTEYEEKEIEINATSEDEAKKLAYIQAEEIDDWNNGRPDDVGILSIEEKS